MSERVQGHCPSCGGNSLFLGSGGYVTCSRSDCAEPDAASTILSDPEIHHIVQLQETTFSIQHPLRERLRGDLFACDLHQRLAAIDGPPAKPGRYRVLTSDDRLRWERA